MPFGAVLIRGFLFSAVECKSGNLGEVSRKYYVLTNLSTRTHRNKYVYSLKYLRVLTKVFTSYLLLPLHVSFYTKDFLFSSLLHLNTVGCKKKTDIFAHKYNYE